MGLGCVISLFAKAYYLFNLVSMYDSLSKFPNVPKAPVAPRTPFGELLTYYLKMEPLLFKSAVEDQLSILKEQKEAQEAKEKAAEAMSKAGDQSEVVLYE